MNTKSKKQMMDMSLACNNQNLILIGFMGSGKSSVGRSLSQIFQYTFLDSDRFIAEKQKCSIKEIFEQYGEDYFRNLEKEFIQYAKHLKRHIIATGGGMPIFNDIRPLGKIIYLEVKFQILANRIKNSSHRPLFDANAKELYLKRKSLYEQQCDIKINAEVSIQEVIGKILKKI